MYLISYLSYLPCLKMDLLYAFYLQAILTGGQADHAGSWIE
jgi:hypothetical protein